MGRRAMAMGDGRWVTANSQQIRKRQSPVASRPPPAIAVPRPPPAARRPSPVKQSVSAPPYSRASTSPTQMTARTILRWTGRIALGAVALVLVAGAATFGLTEARMARKYTVPTTRSRRARTQADSRSARGSRRSAAASIATARISAATS